MNISLVNRYIYLVYLRIQPNEKSKFKYKFIQCWLKYKVWIKSNVCKR